MRNLYRTIILALSVVLLGIFCGEEVYAASTSDSNRKNYDIEYCRFVYSKSTGQLRVKWGSSKKQTDKYAELYRNGTMVAKETLQNTTWDVTEIVQKYGAGTYMATVYPAKLGAEYTEISADYTIGNAQYSQICEFDASLYEVLDLWFEYDKENSTVIGHWDEAEKVAGKYVRLKKSTTAVTSWRKATGKSFDFSEFVSYKGSGTYTFEIYSEKLGDSHVVVSDELEIGSDDYKKIKAHVAEVQKEAESKRIGWYKNGPVVWYYYKDYGEKAKNEWVNVEGKTYHFSNAGIMQTGWQNISEKWYYFNSDGSLLKNGTTPDGYKVNADGARLDENGNVVSSKGQKQSPAMMTLLTSCTISIKETGKETGKVKEAEFKGGTGFTVESYTLSKPYEEWKAGDSIRVTANVKAMANYQFGTEVTFSARNCSGFDSTGGAQERIVTFLYRPRMQLNAPTFLHVNSDLLLKWKPVSKASRYKVVISSDDKNETTVSEIVSDSCFDISEYSSENMEEHHIKIYAMAGSGKTSYLSTSPETEIENLEKFIEENTIEGTIKWSDNGMKYIDGDGYNANGWYNMLGGWYHFDKHGWADGPGWYRDMNDQWYYFDSEHRMCTGKIVVDGKEYFLNDGSAADVPLGAWVK